MSFLSNHLAETDVFIAGAGPAGLACAIALARKGFSVRIADGLKPPIDKACGEGLMPDTLAALAALGTDIPVESSAPIRGIRFLDTSTCAIAEAHFPSGQGRGMKRLLLHQILLDRALELGVQFTWQTVIRGITGQGTASMAVDTNRGPIRARFIVGADGHQSRIRTAAGLDRASITARRIGLRQHFAIAPWSESVEVHWSRHGQAYVTPVTSGEVCVAFVARTKFARGVPEALSNFPQLQARLANAIPSDAPRGSITLSRKLHRVTRGDIALLGDASGSVDAVTGEGLSLCFRQALALADTIAESKGRANDLAAYQRAHTAMRRLPHLMARAMLLMDRSPQLQSFVIATLQRYPDMFAKLLALHIGHPATAQNSGAPCLAFERWARSSASSEYLP